MWDAITWLIDASLIVWGIWLLVARAIAKRRYDRSELGQMLDLQFQWITAGKCPEFREHQRRRLTVAVALIAIGGATLMLGVVAHQPLDRLDPT